MQITIAEPTKIGKDIAHAIMNEDNWKLPTGFLLFSPDQKERLEETAYALDFYLGGHERIKQGKTIRLESKGYYHYIGA